MKVKLFFCLFALLCYYQGTARSTQFICSDSTVVPVVFVMDEDTEGLLDDLYSEFDVSLLTLCGNDLNATGAKVVDLISTMEQYANEVNYNINGVKFYYNAYFNKSGSIAHFAFILRPESRNVDMNGLVAFLTAFTQKYRLVVPPKNQRRFSSLGMSAYFPFHKGKIGG